MVINKLKNDPRDPKELEKELELEALLNAIKKILDLDGVCSKPIIDDASTRLKEIKQKFDLFGE